MKGERTRPPPKMLLMESSSISSIKLKKEKYGRQVFMDHTLYPLFLLSKQVLRVKFTVHTRKLHGLGNDANCIA